MSKSGFHNCKLGGACSVTYPGSHLSGKVLFRSLEARHDDPNTELLSSDGSTFATWPADLLATLCESYKARGTGNRYLDNAFWGGEPKDFEEALTRLGTVVHTNALKWVHTRAAAQAGLWPFIKFIHNMWSGDSHGFAFTCTDKPKLRAFLDASPNFCRDVGLMQSDHQAAGPTQCWREVVNGIGGLHICIPNDDTADQNTVAGESGIHIDPHQIVKGKDPDGTCSYSAAGVAGHAKDVGAGVVRRKAEAAQRKAQEELRKAGEKILKKWGELF